MVTLNTFAQIVAEWTTATFKAGPTLRRRRRRDGEFEAFVKAPVGSKAGHLVVLTDKGNLWVRFAPPQFMYPVESRAEMSSIVKGLVSERILFVATYRDDEWRGTTLVRRGAAFQVRRGERAYVLSWSGRYDAS
jgi:hypothetical protein